MEKIKILLTSDLHLGLEKVYPLISGEERLSTFMNIMSLARKHDILLIAGDLINNEHIDSSYFDVINKEFSSFLEDGREIFFTPGSGELKDGAINPRIKGIRTTFTFSDDSDCYVCRSSRGEVYIYGLQSMSRNDKWNIERKGEGGVHIGLFYADFSPQVAGAPDLGCIKKDDMKKMNLDFFALGKSHTFKMFRSSNKILGACSGSTEPCSMDEYGERFAVSIEINGDEIPAIKRIAVNTVKILNDEIDCGTTGSQQELSEKIKSSFPEGSLINLSLTGERNFIIDDSFRTGLAEYFRHLKITDNTIAALKLIIEENTGSDSLMGFFCRNLKQQMISGNLNNMNERLLADIILQGNGKNKTQGAVICDY